MKLKHAIIFIITGFCINIFGALCKILHTPNADIILTAGMVISVMSWILLLYKILTNARLKSFLNE